MPRPRPKHTDHTSAEGSLLHQDAQTEIVKSLAARGYDADKARAFAAAANRAAVHAYKLEPPMTTPGESRQWFTAIRKQAEALRGLLSAAQSFEFPLSVERELASLEVWCAGELAKPAPRQRKRKGKRQLLVEQLFREWQENFGERPKYWIRKEDPPFVAALWEILLRVEGHPPVGPDEREDFLRNLIKQASKAISKAQ